MAFEEEKNGRKKTRAVRVPLSLFKKYEKYADEHDLFTTEVARKVLREHCPTCEEDEKPKKKKDDDDILDEY